MSVMLHRGLRTDGKGWAEGYYYKQIVRNKFSEEKEVLFETHFIRSADGTLFDNLFEGIEVKENTVGVCSGITDKHNKIMWDGDIVINDKAEVRIVTWHQTQACFWLMTEWKTLIDLPQQLGTGYRQHKDWQIIGNIYEKKELNADTGNKIAAN